MKKTFATVCSGIGAPEVAAARLGWQCLFGADIEPFPNAVRACRFPGVPNLGDMTRYKEWPIRCECEVHQGKETTFNFNGYEIKITRCEKCGGIRVDVLIAGTPCQAFSVAGLRKGMADPRGNLTLTFLGIVERYAPRWILWENVPGVHSSWSDVAAHAASETSFEDIEKAIEDLRATGLDLGTTLSLGQFEEIDQSNDFDNFVSALEQLSYGVATAVYDAQYFRVAQRRRRVFVVGHIGGQWQRAAAVLFERESLCGNPPPSRETRKSFTHDVAPCLGASGRGVERVGETRGQDAVIAEKVCPNCGGKVTTDHNSFWCDICKQLWPILTEDGFATPEAIPIQEIGKRQSGTPMFTLQSAAVHGVAAPIAFDEVQITSKANRTKAEPGLPAGTMSKESRLSIAIQETAHSLRADGFDASEDGTGRGTPLVPVLSNAITRNPATAADGFENKLIPEIVPTLRAGGNKTGGDRPPGTDVDTCDSLIPEVCSAVTSKWAKSSGGPSGDECQNLTIAFPGTMSGTQRASAEELSCSIGAANPMAVAFRNSGQGYWADDDKAAALGTEARAVHENNLALSSQSMAVRRLTPRECERLQGFPDDFTFIEVKPGKMAADGPRYKALGNSMAVPVIEWILRRMDLVDETLPLSALCVSVAKNPLPVNSQ